MIVCGFTARLYPTEAQGARFNQWAGALRFLWNRLRERQIAQYEADKTFIWRKALQPVAVAMKAAPATAFLADLPAHAVLDTVARMDGALRKMVIDRKAGRTCGFPKPKKKFVNEAGIYCVNQNTEILARTVKLPKVGAVRMRGGRVPQGRLLSARIWRDGDRRWMLSAQFECARPDPLPASDVMVGIDLGVTTLATVFDGAGMEEVTAPRGLRKAQKRLRRAERAKSRRRKGSARRRVAAARVAAIHRKVRERRKNVLHQLSHRLTAKAGHIKFETLNVKGMAKNRSLALSVADAAMARLVTFTSYKADWRGRTLERIDMWFPSSQTCSVCGEREPGMKNLSRRMFRCTACGHTEGRDRNAARNIYWYGQEGRNRASDGATDGEIGVHDGACSVRVPVEEPSMFTGVGLC